MHSRRFFILVVCFGLVMVFCRTALADGERPPVPSRQAESVETENDRPAEFYSVFETILAQRRLKRENVCDETDPVQKRILEEYGAVFLAAGRVQPPPVCMFAGEEEVAEFQASTVIGIEEIGGVEIELQAAAMAAYLNARREAQGYGLDITPRDGAEGARRSFADTARLWNTRFWPAADYWLIRGRLSWAEVEKLKSLPVKEQVKEVLNLEKRGIFFNSTLNASILYSVAPPGASQHISMLALDINEFGSKKVREILARHGWFRTVKADAPHFTFLGRKKDELKKLGLKKFETAEGEEYWIPNV